MIVTGSGARTKNESSRGQKRLWGLYGLLFRRQIDIRRLNRYLENEDRSAATGYKNDGCIVAPCPAAIPALVSFSVKLVSQKAMYTYSMESIDYASANV